MYRHASEAYICPLCPIGRGEDQERPWQTEKDIVYRDAHLTAFISSHWWPNNPGHIIIIPNRHFENIYEMPDELLGKVATLAKRVTLALKLAYNCDGTSVRQHNEPAGYQDVFHYHFHVFPRYEGDRLYARHAEKRLVMPEERWPYAEKVRTALGEVLREQSMRV